MGCIDNIIEGYRLKIRTSVHEGEHHLCIKDSDGKIIYLKSLIGTLEEVEFYGQGFIACLSGYRNAYLALSSVSEEDKKILQAIKGK